MNIQIKAIEQYFVAVLFIMLYMVVLTFESLNFWVKSLSEIIHLKATFAIAYFLSTKTK